MILDLAKWDKAFERLLELRPHDDHLRTVRGRYYALRRQWAKAAENYSRGIASAPADSEEWFEYACLQCITGDGAGYDRFIQEIAAKEGKSKEPIVAYVLARAASLSPEPVVAPAQVIRWAEQAVASDTHAPWYLHVLGIAQFRAGHFDEAIKQLEASIAGGWGEEGKAQNQLVLAMAHHRLGNTTKARALLEEVIRWWNTVELAEADGAASLPATDWLARQVLRREAEALVLQDPAFPDVSFAR
jgi:tetratricopeptide (TPR) repeat protein